MKQYVGPEISLIIYPKSDVLGDSAMIGDVFGNTDGENTIW